MSVQAISFVTKKQALILHSDSIEIFGGSHGLRDENVFESALFAAENRHYYENADLTVCAATYAFHLTQAHAFVDGNKRIGAGVAIAFLRRNNASLNASQAHIIELFLKIAASEMTRDEVEAFFLQHTKIND